MEKRTAQLHKYMEESKNEVRKVIEALVNDDRADEARAYRASQNIYDVFAALVNASAKKACGNEEQFKTEFHQLAEKIPENWRKSLEEAKKHDDAEKIMIEEAKLKTADEIIAKFDSLF